MCLIAFAIDADPATPLLIASNRDEFFDRPTAPLHRWALPNGVEVIGGRDLRDGGTWLGVNAQGRVAMLTNVRNANAVPAPRSRGELANRWLAGEMEWPDLLESLSPADYGGFNLVVGDAVKGQWGWVSNRNPENPHGSDAPALHSLRLAPGVYGLSNAALDTDWPKAQRLKQALATALQQPDPEAVQAILLQALGDAQPAEPNTLPQTGVPLALEQSLSSPFVHIPANGYGTRSSLLIRMERYGTAKDSVSERSGSVSLDEWTHSVEPSPPVNWPALSRKSERLTW
jgi:uncharacterized protein with NRDE domain